MLTELYTVTFIKLIYWDILNSICPFEFKTLTVSITLRMYSISTIPKILMMHKCEGFVDAIGFEDDDNACNSQDDRNNNNHSNDNNLTLHYSKRLQSD